MFDKSYRFSKINGNLLNIYTLLFVLHILDSISSASHIQCMSSWKGLLFVNLKDPYDWPPETTFPCSTLKALMCMLSQLHDTQWDQYTGRLCNDILWHAQQCVRLLYKT